MKAIILAGGKSSRLKDFTENKPKCLLEVNNKPILEYQLEALIECNIKDLIIVVGYKGFMIKNFIDSNFPSLNVTYIENDDYATTGTSYGWWLARDQIKKEESILHLNADLIFFPELLKRLLNHKGRNVVCIDKKIQLNKSMEQVLLLNDSIMVYMDKRNIKKADGKAVGVAKFSNDSILFMLNKIEKFIKKGDKTQHFYGMIRLALNYFVFHGLDINPSFFREVNTEEDYVIAKKSTPKESKKTFMIMLYGLPATGKTTISRKLRDYFEHEMNTKLMSTFRLREDLKLTDLYSKEEREAVYNHLFNLVEDRLIKNINKCIILDGNFNKKDRRQHIYDLAKKYNADLYILECVVDSKIKIKQRMNERKKHFGILEHKASSMDLFDMIKDTTDPIEEDEEKYLTIIVDTEGKMLKQKSHKESLETYDVVIRGIMNVIN